MFPNHNNITVISYYDKITRQMTMTYDKDNDKYKWQWQWVTVTVMVMTMTMVNNTNDKYSNEINSWKLMVRQNMCKISAIYNTCWQYKLWCN